MKSGSSTRNVNQKPDLSPKQYEIKKNEYVQSIKQKINSRSNKDKKNGLPFHSPLWDELCKHLVTASRFGEICKRKPTTSSAKLVEKHLYPVSLENVPAIRHGLENEATALKQLQKQLKNYKYKDKKVNIKECGLFLDDNIYFLGAAPDGIFNGGVVEVKCPYTAYGSHADDAIRKEGLFIWKKDFTINKQSDAFYQIQGELHIAKKDLCIFAVWTGEQFPLKVENIERDDIFWQNNMEHRLVDYYNKCLLPEIIDPRKSRNMPLRDTTY